MKKVLVAIFAVFLVACNEETDVAIVTGKFKHTAQFQERGLNVAVFEMDEVQEATAFLERPDNALALKYTDAINRMAAGTVILNFGGGYEGVVASLRKYSGRTIYCAGAEYWDVEIPEGCTEISSVYSKLDTIAPISLENWKNGTREIPVPQTLHGFVVFVTSKDKLDNGDELVARQPTNILVVDATKLPEETLLAYCSEALFYCVHRDGWVFGVLENEGNGDIYPLETAAYYMKEHEDRPDCPADTWIRLNNVYFGDARFDQYRVPLADGQGDCWSGPTRIVDGIEYIDFEALGGQ